MLHLAELTDPEWGTVMVEHIDEILLDHAHLEKKAAATALNLVFRYPEHPSWVVPLSHLAREELSHFELVVQHIRRRGGEFRRMRPSPYAGRLMEIVRRDEPGRMIDTLLCCAMIEARSCERMQRLAAALEGRGELELARMYEGLLACEARHHRTYVDLLRELGIVDEDGLAQRLSEVAAHEASIIASLPRLPRLHNRAPALKRRGLNDRTPASGRHGIEQQDGVDGVVERIEPKPHA